MSANLLSILVPAFGLFLVTHLIADRVGLKPTFVASGLIFIICLVLLSVPMDGLSLARRLAGFAPGFSVPLTVVLAQATVNRFGGGEFLRPPETRTLWYFGVAMGLALFPATLGLGRWDPYAEGWGFSALFVVVGLLAATLLLKGNRFGWILLVAVIAWNLRLLESFNYWDYLVDPVYCLLAIPMALLSLRCSGDREGAINFFVRRVAPHPPKSRGAQTDA